MKLQGRHLSLNLRGRDVALLHRELRQIGLIIPDDEGSRSFFGPGTPRGRAGVSATEGASPGLFPLKDVNKILKINTVWLLARCTDPGTYSVLLNPPLLPPPPPGSDIMTLAKINQYGGLHFGQQDVSGSDISVAPTSPPLQWVLKMTRPGGGNLRKDSVTNEMEVEDLMLVVGYEWEL